MGTDVYNFTDSGKTQYSVAPGQLAYRTANGGGGTIPFCFPLAALCAEILRLAEELRKCQRHGTNLLKMQQETEAARLELLGESRRLRQSLQEMTDRVRLRATNHAVAFEVLERDVERTRKERDDLRAQVIEQARTIDRLKKESQAEHVAMLEHRDKFNKEAGQLREERRVLRSHVQELTSTVDSLAARLKRRKAKIRKLKEEREKGAIHARVRNRYVMHLEAELRRLTTSEQRFAWINSCPKGETTEAELGEARGRADEREAVLAYLSGQKGYVWAPVAEAFAADIRRGKHLTAPASPPRQPASPAQESAPE